MSWNVRGASVITMILLRLDYLVYCVGNCVDDDTTTKTGLKESSIITGVSRLDAKMEEMIGKKEEKRAVELQLASTQQSINFVKETSEPHVNLQLAVLLTLLLDQS